MRQATKLYLLYIMFYCQKLFIGYLSMMNVSLFGWRWGRLIIHKPSKFRVSSVHSILKGNENMAVFVLFLFCLSSFFSTFFFSFLPHLGPLDLDFTRVCDLKKKLINIFKQIHTKISLSAHNRNDNY